MNSFELLIANLSLAEREGLFLLISFSEGLNILFLYSSNRKVFKSLFSGKYLDGLDLFEE